jgi:phage tail sheath gpL-like
MADLTDVENALVALIAQAVYPNGTALPSVAAIPVKVYAGWPAAAQLDADLRAGIANVSVFPTDSEQNTTRYPKTWQTVAVNAPTLTLAVNAQSVTVGGAVSTPCNLALLVSGKNYVYAVQATDTLTSIATALASLLAVDFPATTSVGAAINLPVSARIVAAKVGGSGTSMREL